MLPHNNKFLIELTEKTKVYNTEHFLEDYLFAIFGKAHLPKWFLIKRP